MLGLFPRIVSKVPQSACMTHSLEAGSLSSCCATAIDEKASDAVSTAKTNASTFRVAILPLGAFSYNRLWAY